mmetsp:Transcript_71373/g.216050  ORF Transcript_71373/g.216050 Transcript_71373/m.216050 type:complete len:206 (+) Transcript_71373:855-1472(+)
MGGRKRDPHYPGNSLVLEVGELGGQARDLREAWDGQPHIACAEPHAEAVGRDGGMHAQPDCQQQVNKGAGNREQVQAIEPRGRFLHPAFTVDGCRETKEERPNQVVHVHFVDCELDQVFNVLPEEIKSLDLHLQPRKVSFQPLLLVELEVFPIIVEHFLGRNANGLEDYHIDLNDDVYRACKCLSSTVQQEVLYRHAPRITVCSR